MTANKVTRDEYKKLLGRSLGRAGDGDDRIQSARKAKTYSSNYEKTKILRSELCKIRNIQTYNPPILFDSSYRLDIEVFGPTRADEDNIRKAFNDALQGTAFTDDKQCKGGYTWLHDR